MGGSHSLGDVRVLDSSGSHWGPTGMTRSQSFPFPASPTVTQRNEPLDADPEPGEHSRELTSRSTSLLGRTQLPWILPREGQAGHIGVREDQEGENRVFLKGAQGMGLNL